MMLIYDSKCSVCRSLAHKVRFASEDTVEIRALSDPEAIRVLDRFYPDGWSHNFYAVDGDACRPGARALPKLLRRLGPRRTVALAAEYAAFKVSRKRCAAGHRGHEAGHDVGRREVLKLAALTPVALGLSKVPKLADPFAGVPEGMVVNLVTIEPDGLGGYRATARRCDDCLRPAQRYGTAPEGASMRVLDREVLSDVVLPASLGSAASLKIRRTTSEAEISDAGSIRRSIVSVHNVVLDHPRYNVVLNVGVGPDDAGRELASMSAMVGHDLPIPVIDHLVYRNGARTELGPTLGAYAEGIRTLERLHAREGRRDLADLYAEIGRGLNEIGPRYAAAVVEQPAPLTNEAIITSTPELLKFVDLSQNQLLLVAGRCRWRCRCACHCACCCECGCGCGCGACGCICSCDCCCECGCSCGCGCCYVCE